MVKYAFRDDHVRVVRDKPRRGRPVKSQPEYKGKVLYVMDITTFVNIPDAYRHGIYQCYHAGGCEKPPRDPELERVFYKSLAQNEVVSISKWMAFLNKGGGKLIREQPSAAAEELGLKYRGEEYLELLSKCELQRWIEWYYITMIRKHGKCFTSYDFYDPGIVSAIAIKYGLSDFPCATTPSEEELYRTTHGDITQPETTEEYETRTQKKRGSKLGEPKTKINLERVGKIRNELMKCRAVPDIAKEMKVSDATIYNAMRPNMFKTQNETKRSIDEHIDNIKRLVGDGTASWAHYASIYALCEKGVMRELYRRDPVFVNDHHTNLAPTKESLAYDHSKCGGNTPKLAKLYGVSEDIMREWLSIREVSVRNIPINIIPKKIHAKSKPVPDNVIDYDKWGIDPNYNPLAGDKNIKFGKDMLK